MRRKFLEDHACCEPERELRSEKFSVSLILFLSSESECAKDCCEASGHRSNVDDADDDRGESALAADEKDAEGAGHPGEAGATGTGKSSGVLPPLGEFDPADPNFELFDPCTEITNVQLQQHGLERYEGQSVARSGHKICSFKRVSEEIVLSIGSTYKSFDVSRVNPDLVVDNSDEKLAGVVIHRGEVFSDLACSATFSTVRGVVTVSANSFGKTKGSACTLASSMTKELI